MCEFYRAEPDFLLQGSMRAYIPSYHKMNLGPRFMQRGDVGWAGTENTTHFFIYLSKEPAVSWNKSTTVWGEVADEQSMRVVERINSLPVMPSKPGELRILEDREPFNISVHRRQTERTTAVSQDEDVDDLGEKMSSRDQRVGK